MWSNLAGYALVGLPLGAWLCTSGWGARGIWWGLVAGLVAVAVLLDWRVHVIICGELKRL
jgi:MATE family multidrug resistance protein